MSKNDKIYRIVSIIGLLLHIFVFVFVLIVGFLPFHENKNFYECFTGYFGENLSIYQPYFIMAIMFISCVPALLAIKYPPISFFTGVFMLFFFAIVVLPYTFEAAFVGLASPWIGAEMSTYGIGFELMGAVSYIIYFDMAFFIYSIITILIRAKTNPYMVLMFCVAFILMLILCSCKVNEDSEEITTVNYNVEIVEKLFQIPVEYEVVLGML